MGPGNCTRFGWRASRKLCSAHAWKALNNIELVFRNSDVGSIICAPSGESSWNPRPRIESYVADFNLQNAWHAD